MKVISLFFKREFKDIFVSMVVLSVIFAYPEFLFQPSFILISLLIVGIAFMGHELSHRFVARKLGYWAEYRMWNQGLFLAALLAFVSGGRIIFAAPGAVVFSSWRVFKNPTREEVGKIGVSGPLFNIGLLYLFLLVHVIYPVSVLRYAAWINGWLAIFNLIPFPHLDGSKVFYWDLRVWIITFIAAVAGFVYALSL